MIDINEMRRLAQAATPGPWFTWKGGVYAGRPKVKKRGELRGYEAKICEMDDMDGTTRSRKANARLIAAANPAAITEILDRLEAAERDNALKEEVIDSLAVVIKRLETETSAELEAAERERDALQAKIAEMEKQEPIAKVRVHQTGGNAGLAWSVAPLNDFDSLTLMRDGDRLYALPGAKGE